MNEAAAIKAWLDQHLEPAPGDTESEVDDLGSPLQSDPSAPNQLPRFRLYIARAKVPRPKAQVEQFGAMLEEQIVLDPDLEQRISGSARIGEVRVDEPDENELVPIEVTFRISG